MDENSTGNKKENIYTDKIYVTLLDKTTCIIIA